MPYHDVFIRDASLTQHLRHVVCPSCAQHLVCLFISGLAVSRSCYFNQQSVLLCHLCQLIDVDDLRNPKACYSFIKERIIDNETYYVLLDEVQFMDRFEEVLNALLRMENVDVYVTGSNSRFLSV